MDAYKNLLQLRQKAAAQAKAEDKGAFVTDPAAASKLDPTDVSCRFEEAVEGTMV